MMKKLLFLVLLTPLMHAEWIDTDNYKISSFKLDGNTKFDKYCLDNTVVLIATNTVINQMVMIQMIDEESEQNGEAKRCRSMNKLYWEENQKGK
ncbi:hypothetical protein N9840_00900 [Gammaproteobacteria bacterium]|nr:hypothetical protein [Gammaproteobacteria bacterium]